MRHDQAAKLQKRYGWNRLPQVRRRSLLGRFFGQFTELFAILMIIASAITYIVYLLGGRNSSDLSLSLAILGGGHAQRGDRVFSGVSR